MSQDEPDENVPDDLGEQQDAPPVGSGTDIGADDLDPDAEHPTPATSDADEYVDGGELGGTGGPSPGGAG